MMETKTISLQSLSMAELNEAMPAKTLARMSVGELQEYVRLLEEIERRLTNPTAAQRVADERGRRCA
jgi:hypothetical protein